MSHNKKILKYYISDTDKDDPTKTWTTLVGETVANEIKNAFVNSMKQWNDVYFYSYNSNGTRNKNKIIDIVA